MNLILCNSVCLATGDGNRVEGTETYYLMWKICGALESDGDIITKILLIILKPGLVSGMSRLGLIFPSSNPPLVHSVRYAARRCLMTGDIGDNDTHQ